MSNRNKNFSSLYPNFPTSNKNSKHRKSKIDLKIGIPTIENYKKLLRSDLFLKMEKFSNKFIKSNESVLVDYSKKWAKDPLHQWSRQWEYPFVHNEIYKFKKDKQVKDLNILDAGSGITFFPYLISKAINKAKITCVDIDSSLQQVFSYINKGYKKHVNFVVSDIHKLPYKNSVFDIVYCISVLEHTRNYEEIIKEFRRILKPNGTLIVTFDISIDGNADIPPEDAKELVQTLLEYFPEKRKNQTVELIERNKLQNVVSTKYISEFDKNLLPWKYPLLSNLKSIFKFRLPTNNIKNLTFFCYTFKLFS